MDAKEKSQAILDELAKAQNTAPTYLPHIQPWDPELIKYLATGVLGFCVISLVLCALLLARQRASSGQILRLFGILSIINVSAFLLIVGYGADQLTPIIGLFGGIAGYLLGKDPQQTPAGSQIAAAPTGIPKQ